MHSILYIYILHALKVALLMLTDNVSLVPKFQLVEYFAGKGEVSRIFKQAGKAVFSYDRDYTQSMDILSYGGFAQLVCTCICCNPYLLHVHYMHIYIYNIYIYIYIIFPHTHIYFYRYYSYYNCIYIYIHIKCIYIYIHINIYTHHVCFLKPRSAVCAGLSSSPGALHLYAPVCSSYTFISSGTHCRNPMNMLGNTSLDFVRDGTMMLSRLHVCMFVEDMYSTALYICTWHAWHSSACISCHACMS